MPGKLLDAHYLNDPKFEREKLEELKISEEERGCDLLIVAGTGLAVMPFCFTVDRVPENTPSVLVNLENTFGAGYDFEDTFGHPNRLFLQGKCDDTIIKLCKDVGWYDDLKKLIDKNKKVPVKDKKVVKNKTK